MSVNAINFALVNINCSLWVRHDNGSFDYYNSKQKLHNVIIDLINVSILILSELSNDD